MQYTSHLNHGMNPATLYIHFISTCTLYGEMKHALMFLYAMEEQVYH